MKWFQFVTVSLIAATTYAAPFVTPGMIRRNGLTDAQYAQLWAQGKNPSIDQAAARDWIFRASRFQNVTNWLDICGKTNDFAALSYDLQDKNFKLAATNAYLVATNGQLTATCKRLANVAVELFNGYTNQLAHTSVYSNAMIRAENRAASATNRLARIETFLETKRDAAKLSTTKALYQAILDALKED